MAGMKARWVLREGPDEFGLGPRAHDLATPMSLGSAIVATWWPGRYYRVSTIQLDTSSTAAKAVESLKTGVPLHEIPLKVTGYVTQVAKCDKMGWVGDWIANTLFERTYADAAEAQAGHNEVVDLLQKGRLKLVPQIADR